MSRSTGFVYLRWIILAEADGVAETEDRPLRFAVHAYLGAGYLHAPAMEAAAAFCSSEKIEFHINPLENDSQPKLVAKSIFLASFAAGTSIYSDTVSWGWVSKAQETAAAKLGAVFALRNLTGPRPPLANQQYIDVFEVK